MVKKAKVVPVAEVEVPVEGEVDNVIDSNLSINFD
jgi:hypothetical protein